MLSKPMQCVVGPPSSVALLPVAAWPARLAPNGMASRAAATTCCRGYTVCHVAAQYGQTAILYHLALKWGADTDALDSDGRSPLHWAAYKGFAGGVGAGAMWAGLVW